MLSSLSLIEWGGKKISHSTDMTNFLYSMSYVYDPGNTKTETKEEI